MMVVVSEMDDEKNIEMQLRERAPGVAPVSVVGAKSVPTRLYWRHNGINYRADLVSPKYRIQQMTKKT